MTTVTSVEVVVISLIKVPSPCVNPAGPHSKSKLFPALVHPSVTSVREVGVAVKPEGGKQAGGSDTPNRILGRVVVLVDGPVVALQTVALSALYQRDQVPVPKPESVHCTEAFPLLVQPLF